MNEIILEALKLCPVEFRVRGGAARLGIDGPAPQGVWFAESVRRGNALQWYSAFEAEAPMEKFWREKLGWGRYLAIEHEVDKRELAWRVRIGGKSPGTFRTFFAPSLVEALAAAIVHVYMEAQ